MRKWIFRVGLGAILFLVALTGILAYYGQLNMESISRIWKDAPVVEEEGPDELDPVLRALQAREQELDEREAELREARQRLDLREQELQTRLTELQNLLAQVNEAMQDVDADREERIQQLAATFSAMDADAAAQALAELPEDDAAMYLRHIEDDDSRADILSEMDPRRVALITQRLQAPAL